MSEELDDLTFDLEGDLYNGLAGNSDNPIDTDEPEVQPEDTSCPGGACKLQLFKIDYLNKLGRGSSGSLPSFVFD